MLNSKDIINLYKKYNVQASKRFGQNFLIDNKIIEQIIDYTNCKNSYVVEIGPGLGSLTLALLQTVKKLIAFEIDTSMIKVLKAEIKDPKFILKNEDFLKANFEFSHKQKIIANIPYHITSLILFKIFKNINFFSSATLMVQKEVGERLIALPKTKDYGKLSVTTQLLAEVTKVVDVPSSAFVPQPKVDSMVVNLAFKKVDYDHQLANFIKICFAQQRKKLTNNLKPLISSKKLVKILEKHQFKVDVRPQELSPQDFLKIYQSIYI